jgi:hypothetical protein
VTDSQSSKATSASSDRRDRFAALFASQGIFDLRFNVKGSLCRSLAFWEELIPGSWLLPVMASGYVRPISLGVIVPPLFPLNIDVGSHRHPGDITVSARSRTHAIQRQTDL